MKQHEILHGVFEPESVNQSFYKAAEQPDDKIPVEPDLESLVDENNECLKLESVVLKDKTNNDYTATYFVVKSLPNPKNNNNNGNTGDKKKNQREKGSGT